MLFVSQYLIYDVCPSVTFMFCVRTEGISYMMLALKKVEGTKVHKRRAQLLTAFEHVS